MSDRKIFKALIVWLELKPLFYDGKFKQISSRINELALYLDISPRSLRYKLKILEKESFIHFNSKNEMLLCSWDHLHRYFDEGKKDPRKYRYHRLQNSIDVEIAIRQLLIEENFKKQNKAIDIKLFQQEIVLDRQMQAQRRYFDLQKNALIPDQDKERQLQKLQTEMQSYAIQWRDTKTDPEYQKFRNSGKIARLFVDAYKTYESQLSTFEHGLPFVNPAVTLSCQGIAKLFGLKSKASGHYWEQRLKERGRVQIRKRSILVPHLGINQYNHAVQNMSLESNYFWTSKGFFRRLPNAISVIPLVTA